MPQDTIKTTRISVTNAALLAEVTAMVSQGHTVTLPLRGFSMRPFLEDRRDKALLTSPDGLAVGDVVLAEIAPGRYVLHRLIALDEHQAILRGDGNLANEYCRPCDIRAKAVGFYRKGRATPDRTDSRKWRIYSWWWMRLYPLRRYLLFVYRLLFIHPDKP